MHSSFKLLTISEFRIWLLLTESPAFIITKVNSQASFEYEVVLTAGSRIPTAIPKIYLRQPPFFFSDVESLAVPSTPTSEHL